MDEMPPRNEEEMAWRLVRLGLSCAYSDLAFAAARGPVDERRRREIEAGVIRRVTESYDGAEEVGFSVARALEKATAHLRLAFAETDGG